MGVQEDDAEEIALDVLLTVHSNVKTYRPGKAKLTTWIFEIAKNRAVDYHRVSNSRSAQLPPQVAGFKERDFEYAGRNQEYMEWLLNELKELSQEDRDLLNWRANETPYAEIARWLGIAEGTARVRHKRVMERILAKAKDLEARKGATQLGREILE
jgi:RNA polymerase sigma factor (sigma-70 family)